MRQANTDGYGNRLSPGVRLFVARTPAGYGYSDPVADRSRLLNLRVHGGRPSESGFVPALELPGGDRVRSGDGASGRTTAALCRRRKPKTPTPTAAAEPWSLRSEQHRQDRGVWMADRVDADPADHRRDGAVGLGLHPCGAVFQAEVRKAGQQDASGGGARALGQRREWSPRAGAASSRAGGWWSAKYPGGTADSPTTGPSARTSPTVPGAGASGSSSRAPKIVVVASSPGSDATLTATISSCAHSLVESGQRPDTTKPFSDPASGRGRSRSPDQTLAPSRLRDSSVRTMSDTPLGRSDQHGGSNAWHARRHGF